MKYYIENDTGDYLTVDPSTNAYYLDNFGKDEMEGRATAIANQVNSVCTTGIARQFLNENCTPVKRSEVPRKWLAQF